MTVIQVQKILTGFQTKLSLFKIGILFKYFSNLLKLEKGGSIADIDLEIYANHLKNLSYDFESTL